MNGIYIAIPNNYYETSIIHQNAYKYVMDVRFNSDIINIIQNIENELLSKINLQKTPQRKINDLIIHPLHLNSKYPKFNIILFKISGICQTSNTFSIVFKFIPLPNN